MMRFLRRARPLDDFIEAIRPELKALPTPVATDTLKARIATSRAAGVRHILPVPHERRSPVPMRVALAVAAAAILLLIPIELRRSAGVENEIVSPGVFGHMVFAEAVGRSAAPALEPVRITNGSGLRPMSLTFDRRSIDNRGRASTTSSISLQVSAALLGNLPVWRIISVDRDQLPTPHVGVESVFVAKSDMRLLGRSIHVSPYRRWQRINVLQRFNGDSVTGRMTTEGPSIGAGRSFRRNLPRALAPFVTEAISPVFLMSLPLNSEWRGSASLLGWAVRDDDVLLPIELRVESGETITVPAGTFDCWRMSLRFSGRQIDYWVRKSDGLGVRVLDTSEAKTKGTREIVLTRIR